MARRKGDRDKQKRKRRGEKAAEQAATPTNTLDPVQLAADLLAVQQQHQQQQQGVQETMQQALIIEQNQILASNGLVKTFL